MSTRRLGLVAAWLVATLLAVVLASQAVGLVRDQVTDRPSRTVSTILASAATPSTIPLVSTPENVDPQAPERTSTEPPSTTQPPTTTQPGTTTSTSTTVPASTTTTTQTETEERFTMIGGWVTVGCSANQITFKSAAPAPGFTVERTAVEDNKVDVKFESSDHTSKFRAECHDGAIAESIEEQTEQDDD